jgi:predicted transcriptional regulator
VSSDALAFLQPTPVEMGRTYRTRLEVLHDFLDASRRASRKTRIIGLANLNPSYFETYAQFCLEHHLLERTAEGYRSTELADQVIVAIRRVLSKTTELDGAIRSLNVVIRQDDDSRGPPEPTPRTYPTYDWQEILLHSVPRLSLPNSGVSVRGPRDPRVPGSDVAPRMISPAPRRARPPPELAP